MTKVRFNKRIWLCVSELLTEVMPMIYDANASSIVRRVYIYMSVTNRSISSVEVLKSAASVLVNLARYRVTGPKIYAVSYNAIKHYNYL